MFCQRCGEEIKTDNKYCVNCGVSLENSIVEAQQTTPNFNNKWWNRLLKVLYVITYFPLLVIIPIVWNLSSQQYDQYGNYSGTSYSTAFWYSLLVFVIYIVILRLIKIAVLYVAFGQSPDWRKQFKKLF